MLVINNQNYICSLDYAVSLIKGKWKAVIICHLNDQSYRFLELQRKLPGISEKVLTEKLRELENDGLVERVSYPEIPPRVEYRLTPLGLSLFKVLDALQIWGEDYIAQTKKLHKHTNQER
ncbi:winged helix-turn-helix transcriptional regulator [Sporolituus thermophilus]|uniref:Transcriptional regulator, HxlR family n=1 Tax=Sporolituus thermophilus DSM 23256 TaxID=1123285 RepID=A0A1G7MQR3_9FIRM|nr:helix-turn-helix domain-containing protein [Sporolituus thermophilus]SDF64092.1 transcriptional regulator, HxlR family [Sporolituus thermophilus DSM 23256]